MNTRHRKTLREVFADPIDGNLEWRRLDALFVAAGAMRVRGSGSRITFVLNGIRASFHRPHPGKEALRYRVIAARDFLTAAGVRP